MRVSLGQQETVDAKEPPKKEFDIYRDSSLRYVGYANEVGESFRPLIHVQVVRLSYVVAAGYCLADTVDKALKMKQNTPDGPDKNRKIAVAAGDTLTWQLMASVIIPGFTINRICAISLHLLQNRTALSFKRSKWTTTAIGLLSIPFIIKPIDHSVDYIMDNSIRTLY